MTSAPEAVGVCQLLVCPFCGGEKVKTFGPYGWNRQWGISHSCRFFYNGAQEMAQGFHTEAEAIAAWNTRVDTADNAKLVELLRTARPYVALKTESDEHSLGDILALAMIDAALAGEDRT